MAGFDFFRDFQEIVREGWIKGLDELGRVDLSSNTGNDLPYDRLPSQISDVINEKGQINPNKDIVLNRDTVIKSEDYLEGRQFGQGILISQEKSRLKNLYVEGYIETAIFKYDTVQSVGSNIMVAKGAAKLLKVYLDGSDWHIVADSDADFSANDYIRIDGALTEWMKVTADNGDYSDNKIDSGNDYTVQRDKEGVYGTPPPHSDNATITNFGTDGDGGVTIRGGSNQDVSIFKFNQSTYSLDEKARFGNLLDYSSFTRYSGTEEIGIAIGSSSGDYFTYDTTNGIEMTGSITLTNTIDSSDISDVDSYSTGQDEQKLSTLLDDTPAGEGSGLYMDATRLGYFDDTDDTWKTYMDNSGNFYLSGSDNHGLSWNGSTLDVDGTITVRSGSGIGNFSDAGSLATQNNADWDGDISNIPARFDTDTGNPPSSGLYLTEEYSGYWGGSSWDVYIANNGNFAFNGNGSNYITWNGSTLDITAETFKLDTTNIDIDSSSSYLAINSSTWQADGIQLQYNSGNPRAYIGDGGVTASDKYFMFDGSNIAWDGGSSSLSTAGKLTTTNAEIGNWSVSTNIISDSNNTIELDSSNEIITINDGTYDRIKLGKISTGVYGLQCYTSDNTLVFDTSKTDGTGAIAQWTINSTSLTTDSGAVGMSSTDTYSFWAGNSTPGSAPFSVTQAGALTATSATITGTVNATGGTFTNNITLGSGATTATFKSSDNNIKIFSDPNNTDYYMVFGNGVLGDGGFQVEYDTTYGANLHIGQSNTGNNYLDFYNGILEFSSNNGNVVLNSDGNLELTGSITGGTIQTSDSAVQRVVVDGTNNRISFYNSTNPNTNVYFQGVYDSGVEGLGDGIQCNASVYADNFSNSTVGDTVFQLSSTYKVWDSVGDSIEVKMDGIDWTRNDGVSNSADFNLAFNETDIDKSILFLTINGSDFVDNSRNINVNKLNINGTTIIDSSENATVNSIDINGQASIDSSGNIQTGGTYKSSDGTSGDTDTVAVPAGTLNFKDGLFTGLT